MTAPYLIAYVDEDRGLTLVRGYEAKRVLTVLGHRPHWSKTGRGWVVRDVEVCHDLAAYANSIGTFATISHRRPT